MIAGTQSPAAGLLQAVSNKLFNKPMFGSKDLPAGEPAPSGDTGAMSIDSLSLSPDALAVVAEGMEALQTIRAGQEELLQKDIELATKRLEQIREQMDFVATLMASGANPDDKSVRGHIREIGKALKQFGQTLRMMVRGAEQAELLGSVAGIASESFNATASVQPTEGLQASYKQSLSIEITSIQVTMQTASLSISEGEDGALTAAITSEETTLSYQSINLAYEESLTLAPAEPNPLDGLVAAWASLVNDYTSLAGGSSRGADFAGQLATLSEKLFSALPQQPAVPGETLDEAA